VDTTTIAGKVILPDGTAAAGGKVAATLALPGSVTDPATSEGERVAGRYSGTIAATGDITGLALVPNDIISPAGTYYLVQFTITDPSSSRTSWTEKWSVTSAPDPIDIGAVARLEVAPGLSLPQTTHRTLQYFRASQAGSITDRYYTAGKITAGNFSSNSFAPGYIYASPILVSRASTLDSIQFSVSVGGNIGAQGRVCLYTNKADDDPYPDTLLAGSECNATIKTTGAKICTISVAATADTLYWAAFENGDTVGAPTFSSIVTTVAYPIFGGTGIAVQGTQAYGAGCPPTFPAGGVVLDVAAPAVSVRFSN